VKRLPMRSRCFARARLQTLRRLGASKGTSSQNAESRCFERTQL
jgi:hypothetical protein